MTGDKKVAFYTKKIFGLTEIRDWFLGYLDKLVRDFTAHVWGIPGFFAVTDIDISVIDEVSLTVAPHAADGSGNLIEATDPDDYESLPFENTLGTTYHVGVSRALRAYGIETNPRTGEVEYRAVEEVIGKSGTPDSVTDLGGTIEMVVDSVCDTGVSQAGRTVLIYLASPVSGLLSEAFEECLVVWSGGVNKIVTTGTFGQSSVSTTPADYVVILKGCLLTTRDLRLDSSVAYVGSVVGAGAGNPPASKDISEQRVFFDGGIGNLGDVLALCIHGHTKIRVKADSGDAASEVQIAVHDTALGTDTFAVTKAGNVAMGKTLASSDTLEIDDANTTVPVPFSSVSDIAIDTRLPSNVLGAVNKVVPVWDVVTVLSGTHLTSGGVVTDGGGLDVDITAAEYIDGGELGSVSAGSLTMLDNMTSQVYLQVETGTFQYTTSKGTAFANIPLAQVTTTAGFVTEILDYRRLANDLPSRGPLLVGPTPDCHFITVRAAIEAIGVLAASHPATAPYRTWEIALQGGTEETGTITIPCGGIRIRGSRGEGAVGGAEAIKLTGDFSLFDLNGKSDLEFDGLHIYQSAGGISPAPTAIFCMTGSSDVKRLRITNCRHFTAGASHGFFLNGGTGMLKESFILNNIASNVRDFGISLGKCENVNVCGNKLARYPLMTPAASKHTLIEADTGTNLLIADNVLEYAYATGIKLVEVGRSIVRNNIVLVASDGCGISAYRRISPGATDLLIEGNTIEILATTAGATVFGVQVLQDRTRVVGNTIITGGGGDATTTVHGVHIGGSTEYVLITGNDINLDSTGGIVTYWLHVVGPAPSGDYVQAVGNFTHGAALYDNNSALGPMRHACNPGSDQVVPIIWEAAGSINATMSGGSGTGSYTLDSKTTRWKGSVNTDGNWNSGGTITLTITRPGTTTKSGWKANTLGGAVRFTTITCTADTITIVMNNVSGSIIPAGTAVTVGMLAYEGEMP